MTHLIAHDDKGGTDLLFAFPLMFLMILGIVQYGLWAHAHHRAQAIATQSLAAGRTFEGSAQEGSERGHALADDLGGTLLQDIHIQVHRRGGTAHVTVDGAATGLIPGWSPPVSTTLVGPIERPHGADR